MHAPAMKLPSLITQAKQVLVVGGTFDPPHVAHFAQAQVAARKIQADALLYIPAGLPPQKQHLSHQASPQHRLAMVRLMLQDCSNAAICTFEIDRQLDPAWSGKPSFTAATLAALHDALHETNHKTSAADDSSHSSASSTSSRPALRLLIGSDQAANFHTWRDYERIIALAEPAVMPRLPWTDDSLLEHIALTQSPDKAAQWKKRLIAMEPMNTSSTEIRECIKKGLPIDQMVSPLVEAYIREHGLYR